MMKTFAASTLAICLVGSAHSATTAYRSLILGDNPVVYYEFDETSGTTLVNSASSGATYNGSFNTTGGPLTVNQPSFALGGTAYDFDGGFIGSASAFTWWIDVGPPPQKEGSHREISDVLTPPSASPNRTP